MVGLAEDIPISLAAERIICCTGAHIDTADVMDVSWKLCARQFPAASALDAAKVNLILTPAQAWLTRQPLKPQIS
jgi:hypothetical protein